MAACLKLIKQSEEAVHEEMKTVGERHPVGPVPPDFIAPRIRALALVGLVPALLAVLAVDVVPLPLRAHHLRDVAALQHRRQQHPTETQPPAAADHVLDLGEDEVGERVPGLVDVGVQQLLVHQVEVDDDVDLEVD